MPLATPQWTGPRAKRIARRIPWEAPALLAAECARSSAPDPLFHRLCFSTGRARPYREDDPARPLNVAGRTKHEGEPAISGSGPGAHLPYQVFMPGVTISSRESSRLARERDFLEVVADQVGSPTPTLFVSTVTGLAFAAVRRRSAGGRRGPPLSLAAAHPAVPGTNLPAPSSACRPAWIRLAHGCRCRPTHSDRRTGAGRPPVLNSRLDCSRLESALGLAMPDWQPIWNGSCGFSPSSRMGTDDRASGPANSMSTIQKFFGRESEGGDGHSARRTSQ